MPMTVSGVMLMRMRMPIPTVVGIATDTVRHSVHDYFMVLPALPRQFAQANVNANGYEEVHALSMSTLAGATGARAP